MQKNRHIQVNPTQANIGTTSLGRKIIPHQATQSRIPDPPRPRPREHRAGSGATLPVPAGQAAHRLWRRLYGGTSGQEGGGLGHRLQQSHESSRDPFRITTPAGDFLNTPVGRGSSLRPLTYRSPRGKPSIGFGEAFWGTGDKERGSLTLAFQAMNSPMSRPSLTCTTLTFTTFTVS